MRVKVYITKAAAIREGYEESGYMWGDVAVASLNQRQRETLASLGDGSLSLSVGTVSEAAIVAALDALTDKREAEAAQRDAETEAAVQDLLAMSPEEFRGVHFWSVPLRRAEKDPRLANRLAARAAQNQEIEKRLAAEKAEAKARTEACLAAEEAERQRQSALRLEQVAVWVRDHGTQNQKERYAAGLLPEAEVLAAIEEEAFAPLAQFPRYELLKAGDVCTCDYERCHVDFSSEGASEATAEEWDAAQAIVAAISPTHPEAVVELREHTGRSRDCDQAVTRKGIRVTLTVGVLKFHREYAIEKADLA